MRNIITAILILAVLFFVWCGATRFAKYSLEINEVGNGIYEVTDWTGITDIYYEED